MNLQKPSFKLVQGTFEDMISLGADVSVLLRRETTFENTFTFAKAFTEAKTREDKMKVVSEYVQLI